MPIYIPKFKSDITLLVKYWQLRNSEISLAESHFWLTWEPDFSQACSFCRMLMNHKNFHFIRIPDKTNAVMFLKRPFLTIFIWWGVFQKIWLCHTKLYMDPHYITKFQKKLMSQFRENVRTDRRMKEEQTEGRTDPIL